jgi:hypothetical protein
MDRKDFNSLGISLDSLIDAFIQSVFAHIAVDRMSDFLCPNGEFSESFFQAVCDDKKLVEEIKEGISLNKKL